MQRPIRYVPGEVMICKGWSTEGDVRSGDSLELAPLWQRDHVRTYNLSHRQAAPSAKSLNSYIAGSAFGFLPGIVREGGSRTTSGYEHVHALRSARDCRSRREANDKTEQDRLASEARDEPADQRKDGCGGNRVRAPGPDKVRAVQLVDDRRQCCGHGRLCMPVGQRRWDQTRRKLSPGRARRGGRLGGSISG